ncbi:YihY family inner membrane protein [Curvivirga sp.]|uniref:YihY family inner membrane protein n=1 Tax=Curvivirga sp. TaxID=2856848 RepID=UPI003B5B0DDA
MVAMLGQKLQEFAKLMRYVLQRFMHDKMQPRAASLTFTSLLAMVPLLAISFAIFAAFPAFENLKAEAQNFIFENFVPGVGNSVQEHLESFTSKAQGGLSAVGIIFLGVTSIMLLVTISGTFNEIWRARKPNSIIARLLVYWAILTLGPLFFGANISISSALFAYARTSGLDDLTGSYFQLASFMPFFLLTIGFMLMFLLIPNYPVRKRDALKGGILAGAILELLKKGFTFYITSFPTYETIYGAMATIPIFLLWIYLSWNVILFSAQFTAALPEWRAGSRKITKGSISLSERLTASLSLLHALKEATAIGKGLTERRMPAVTGMGPEQLHFALSKLEELHFITKSDTGRWHLCRDLKDYRLADLIHNLDLTLDKTFSNTHLSHAWAHRLQNMLNHSEKEIGHIFADDLETILKDMHEEENFPIKPKKLTKEIEDKKTASGMASKALALIGAGAVGNN